MLMETTCRRAGIVAAVGLTLSAAALRAQGGDAVGTMKGDLRRLVSANEVYHAKNKTYAPNTAALTGFKPSSGVSITLTSVSTTGWAASAVSASLPGKSCVIFVGQVSSQPKTAAQGVSAPEAVAVCDKP
jgi:hypothetical protein